MILRLILVSASFVGQGSLLIFILFLYGGPFLLVQMELTPGKALVWDGLLSVIFFAQHSGMVRRGFRNRLSNFIQPLYHGALYTIVSGLVLTGLIVFWQGSAISLYELQGPARWFVRGFSFITFAGCFWTIFSLRAFDTFGLDPIRAELNGKRIRSQEFVASGPYLWVRHPLYLLVILMLWSCPDLTADRLLFNVLWTVWIFVGAAFEEADLLADFGEKYSDYQSKVPMWIPWKRRPGRDLSSKIS
jgi:protein-S-isoprenylcysteine O-methyltransferase Ste14